MSKGGIAVLIVAALVFTGLGFAFGQVVQAAQNNPATLVTEDYVKQYVGVTVAEMEQRIDELERRILELSGGAATNAQIPEPPDGDPTANPNPVTPTPAPTTVKVQANSLNVRSDVNTSASVVGSVSANTVLTYLGEKADSEGRIWYHVRLANGTEGWVASWFCYDPE